MSRGLAMFFAGTLTVATTYHLFSLNLQKDNEIARGAFSRMKTTMLDSVHQKQERRPHYVKSGPRPWIDGDHWNNGVRHIANSLGNF
ncbi:hypothetical protein HDV06_004414 [Boothiomyces sp. JEL0866]|nr:hypothetical protein HDV06_004414 [Boothiomyces sp. JEL0866]